MQPYTLEKMYHVRGDVWDDGYRHFGPITDEDENPLADPCISCRIQYRDQRTKALGHELSSTSGTITIVDAVNYEFDIPTQALPLGVGVWLWEFETTDSRGAKTWFAGALEVIEDIAHD